MLKLTVTAEELAELPEAVQALYEDGKLQVESDPRIGEFRENNIRLKRERENAETLARAKVAEEMTALNTRLEAVEAREKAALAKANAATLQQHIANVGKKLGVETTALPDVLARAREAGWDVKDGTPVPLDSEGNIVQKGDAPLSMGQWLNDLKANGGGHLFAQARGPDGIGGRATQPNPGGAEVVYDMTPEQAAARIDDIASGKLVLAESGGVQ